MAPPQRGSVIQITARYSFIDLERMKAVSVCLSVCLSVCWSQWRTVKKRLNRSRCRVGAECWLTWNHVLDGVRDARWEKTMSGVVRLTDKYWKSRLRCTQQNGSSNPQ